jgi:O-antigen/teichoic acid export membrane protein
LPAARTDSSEEVPREELTRIAEGAGISFVGKILGIGLQYLCIIVAARILGTRDFGLFTLGLTVLSVAGTVGLVGLDQAVVRHVALYHSQEDPRRVKGVILRSLQCVFLISVVISAILFLSANSVSVRIFHRPELAGVIRWLSLCLPFFGLFTVALSSTKGLQIMKYAVYGQNLFWPFANLVLLGVFCAAGLELTGVVSAYVISVFLTAVLSIYFVWRAFSFLERTGAVYETRRLLRFSLPLSIAVYANLLILWTDRLMLGYFRPLEEVGLYHAAAKTAMLACTVLLSFNAIFSPIIVDLYNKKENEKLASCFRAVTQWIYMLSLPVFFIIALLSKDIMAVFGADFAQGWLPLVILAFAQLVNAASGSVGFMLAMTGRQNTVMYVTLAVCLLNVVLNYFLVPAYGMTGAAVASGISIVVLNISFLLAVHHQLTMHPYSMKFARIFLLGLACCAAAYLAGNVLVDMSHMPKIVLIVVMFLAIYSGLMLKWGVDDTDKILLRDIKERALRAFARRDAPA